MFLWWAYVEFDAKPLWKLWLVGSWNLEAMVVKQTQGSMLECETLEFCSLWEAVCYGIGKGLENNNENNLMARRGAYPGAVVECITEYLAGGHGRGSSRGR
ncbi:hypothetical protein R50073_04150 [Maricurvus nonylphenolicus]